MTSNLSPPPLVTTLSDVFAGLAFMSVSEDPADAAGIAGARWIEAGITYTGAARGSLLLRCPQEFAYELAGNLLFVSPDDPQIEAKSIDAVKELLNILCGRVITTVYGDKPIFDLTPPTAKYLDATPELTDSTNDATLLFVEGWPVHIAFAGSALEK